MKNNYKLLLVVLVIVIISIACGQSNKNDINNKNIIPKIINTMIPLHQEALDKIRLELRTNNTGFNIKIDNLVILQNPVGEGIFIFEPDVFYFSNQSSGNERYYIWVYLEDSLFVVNGFTKKVTSNVLFSNEAPTDLWKSSKLSFYPANDLVGFLFEGEDLISESYTLWAVTSEPEIKFGFSISERKEIYIVILRMELKALAENFEFDYYDKQIADDYGLSIEELGEIAIEGLINEWPDSDSP